MLGVHQHHNQDSQDSPGVAALAVLVGVFQAFRAEKVARVVPQGRAGGAEMVPMALVLYMIDSPPLYPLKGTRPGR